MSIAIDAKAGTHFTGKIFVTPHACDRATEYFGIDRSRAPMHVMDLLRKAAFIDYIVGDDGNHGRLFGYKRTAIVVDLAEATVITVYPQHEAHADLRTPIERLVKRTLATANRKERATLRRVAIEKAELNVERAQCELRKVRTTSRKVIACNDARIAEIDVRMTELDTEVYAAKREKSTIVKGIVAYV